MGLDYSYDLVFPKEELWNVLLSVAAITPPLAEDKKLQVILPDHVIALPFTSDFKTEPIYFNEDTKRLSFDTSLLFKVDNAVRRDIKESEYQPYQDIHSRVAIGYIYLTVSVNPGEFYYLACSPNFCSLSFTAATTSMSILFQNSPFIRQTFIDLLQHHRGVLGIFDDEEDDSRPVLWPPEVASKRLDLVSEQVERLVNRQ